MELEDGEQDGAEERDLQEAEHDQPGEQEAAHSPAAGDRGDPEVNFLDVNSAIFGHIDNFLSH